MTSTDKTDYWSLLGISPKSDLNDLKLAFRKEARKWHPDLNKNDSNAEERFKLINEAYAVLSDPRRRIAWEKNKEYNTQYEDQFKDGFPSYEDYISLILGIEVEEELESEEIDNQEYEKSNQTYEEINSSSNQNWPVSTETSPPVSINEDIETTVHLSVEEALYGSLVEIELLDGTIVEISTPPFAGDGWRLRLEGVAKGGKDHFIQLRVQTSDGLRIDGLRVLYRLELYPPEALLGCEVEIPTLNGFVTLQVPANSSSGRLLRLKRRGLTFEEFVGDQYVEIVIVIPEEISDSELALYKRLQELANQYE
tara:strand:+ start:860 stop:1789 length:930 start_codon:yes stop_codon:yes gene_type:complete